ncbi:21513_t:CDS:2, partial [Cetraspora pellucida]
ETKRSFNFQIVESSEDIMDLKSEAANKLDMVLENANTIENDYKEEVDEMYKGKMNYEADEKLMKCIEEILKRQTR